VSLKSQTNPTTSGEATSERNKSKPAAAGLRAFYPLFVVYISNTNIYKSTTNC